MDRIGANRLFLRAVETGSFSRAAAEAGTTQPTVSKQVAALEAHLGVQLLVRSTRALALTEEGARYYEAAREALDALAAAEATARGQGAAEGTLRAGCPVSFGQAQVVPRLKGLLDAHPGLSVDLVMSDAILDPVEQGVDVAIRIGALRNSAVLARRIGLTQRVAVAAPSYLAGRAPPAEPQDLHHHDCLVHTRLATGADWPFAAQGRTTLVPVRGRVRADSSAAMRGARPWRAWAWGCCPPGSWARTSPRAGWCGSWRASSPSRCRSRPSPRRGAFVDHLARGFAADPHTS